MPQKILLVAEDPGGANCLCALYNALCRNKAYSIKAMAEGVARHIFRQAGMELLSSDSEISFKAFMPDFIVLGTGENSNSIDKQVIMLSRTLCIPTMYVIDYWTNACLRLLGPDGNSLFYAPDYLAVIDKNQKAEFTKLGFPPKRIFVCGHPHFSNVKMQASQLIKKSREKVFGELFPNLTSNKKSILFAAETLGGEQFRRNSRYTLKGRGSTDERTLIVLEELLDAVKEISEDIQVIVRPHPKNRTDDFKAYRSEISEISANGSSIEACYACDLTVGMTSMILLEAVIIGKPVVSIVPKKDEKDWLISNRCNASYCVWTRKSLKRALYEMFRLPGGLKKAANATKRFKIYPNSDLILAEKVSEILNQRSME